VRPPSPPLDPAEEPPPELPPLDPPDELLVAPLLASPAV